ncbi:MobA/MobL protein [Hahella sp. KA22]|uniref:MobA/MobL family protein n=1 Tax=Hahella sp. KA22 TaxID=1628392 RepID=UPI000FDD9F11|nr:MobA/MobL family protein [Hahella sp. KA22]AZZ95609.1 MobA/MobL protein [Hahella sp. KA22]QAY58087.1 MobA/MobL protein [Hahella sp. KA22]
MRFSLREKEKTEVLFMAIFYCQTSLIARSKGRSATAAAAEKIMDERTGIINDYERKKGVLDKFVFNSAGLSRTELWNLAEMSEKRSDSRVAREWILALPHELRRDAHHRIIEQFSQALIAQYQVAIDVCVHAPGRGGDNRNLHAHLLMTTRPMDAAGELGKLKTFLEWSDAKLRKNGLPTGRQQIDAIREKWSSIVNSELEAAGLEERISHLSLQEQGITDKIPEIHVGPLNMQLARMGYHERASRWKLNEAIKAQNNIIDIQTARIARMQNQQQTIEKNDAQASQNPAAGFGGLAATQEAADEAYQQAKKRMDTQQKQIAEQANEERWKPAQIDPNRGSVISMFQADTQGVYRWTKGKNEGAEAFRDSGKAIHSQTINSWALAAELELAQQKVQDREWKEIRAFGSEEYRRAVWIQGQTMGIQVEGYKPTKEELAKYGQAPAQGLAADQKSAAEAAQNRFQQDQKYQNKFEKNNGAANTTDNTNSSSSRSPKM